MSDIEFTTESRRVLSVTMRTTQEGVVINTGGEDALLIKNSNVVGSVVALPLGDPLPIRQISKGGRFYLDVRPMDTRSPWDM